MKNGQMRFGGLIGVLLFCVSTQVAADVCEAERQRHMIFDPGTHWADINWVKDKVHDTMWDKVNYVSQKCPGLLRQSDKMWKTGPSAPRLAKPLRW